MWHVKTMKTGKVILSFILLISNQLSGWWWIWSLILDYCEKGSNKDWMACQNITRHLVHAYSFTHIQERGSPLIKAQKKLEEHVKHHTDMTKEKGGEAAMAFVAQT